MASTQAADTSPSPPPPAALPVPCSFCWAGVAVVTDPRPLCAGCALDLAELARTGKAMTPA